MGGNSVVTESAMWQAKTALSVPHLEGDQLVEAAPQRAAKLSAGSLVCGEVNAALNQRAEHEEVAEAVELGLAAQEGVHAGMKVGVVRDDAASVVERAVVMEHWFKALVLEDVVKNLDNIPVQRAAEVIGKDRRHAVPAEALAGVHVVADVGGKPFIHGSFGVWLPSAG